MMRRRSLLLAAACAPLRARAARAVTLWVPWPAGGATDLALRALAEAAARTLGEPVVVHNRAGAAGTLAMPLLQQAAPDGRWLAQLPQTALRAPWMHAVAWHPLRDTTPIVQVAGTTFGVVVPAASPWHTLDALLDFAQAHPGELTLATNGVGSTPHLVMDELLRRRGARWVHLPYKGTAEQVVAVASGQVAAGAGATGFAPYVDDGRLRLLATFGAQRTRRWPQVPTLQELGHGIVAVSPWGIVGPRGLADDTVHALHRAFRDAMDDAAFTAELERADFVRAYLGPADYASALAQAFAREGEFVRRLGLASAPARPAGS